MGRRSKTKRHNRNPNKRGVRPKERKHLDQVYADIENPEKANVHVNDPTIPGRGRFYCIACSRYFITQATLDKHFQNKQHKRRLKQLKTEEVYLGSDLPVDNGKKLRPAKMETTDQVDSLASVASAAVRAVQTHPSVSLSSTTTTAMATS